VVLEVLEEKLHRSSPSHDPLRQQHNSSIFGKADKLYTADSCVVPLSGNQAPISHTLSAAQHREDRAAIATVENVRVQTKGLSALAVGVEKTNIDKNRKDSWLVWWRIPYNWEKRWHQQRLKKE
jgi:hypothetical protein